ncbi:uncharacterized protein LOC116288606 [Actinia tenebrosa]|uniref:Uncharacterized protein LOC116288606 n=1 Tax=Actinia tenebrosa TaxID=6105 RepID=A0A6P8H717_ACTTE|nr:uncharacterized protein LOC116288606 [Actinia tenebrosa]
MMHLVLGVLAVFLCGHVTTASSICRTEEPCPVSYKTLGCYKDFGHNRVLPNYIYNERDRTHPSYGNRRIDWHNWDKYLAAFSCRCARKAQELGYDLFGVQFYGECWAGHSLAHLSALTKAGAKCVADGFKPCGNSDRYCAGEHHSNFVYQIVNTTCDIEFVIEGCFKDSHNSHARPLANYLLNDRDPTVPSYSGQNIDWVNWDVYVPQLACRCAKKAKEEGSTYFGLQFYGECWSHPQGGETYGRDGTADDCVNNCYKHCDQHPYCIGVQFSNYVYRIKGPEVCDVSIQSMGCYKENPYNRVLGEVLVDATYPPSEKFYGQMQDSEEWNSFFPPFLCKCAHEAKIKGYEYFGVSEYGVCYSDKLSQNYAQLGGSSSCYEGKSSSPCSNGSMACAGSNQSANYIYKIPIPAQA